MIELTLEQVRALAQAGEPATVIDPTTRTIYELVPTEDVGSGGSTHSMTRGGCSPQEALREIPAEPWKHLVSRRHPWRKQLYIKGRNMTVRQLIGGVKANQFTEEQAAANYHLPVEAIREALAYFEANPEVIDLDAAHERYLRKQRGEGRGPQPVP